MLLGCGIVFLLELVDNFEATGLKFTKQCSKLL